VRYALLLKALGATIQLPAFADVAANFVGVDQVVGPDDPPPQFDYYVSLLSLPRIFGTDISSIPANIPYLRGVPEKIAQWSPRIAAEDQELKVGLVWSGNAARRGDRDRSMTLRALAPFGEVRGVRWFSLQKGSREEEAGSPPAGFGWVNLGPELATWGDTAAVISQLDLVICVDTAVAHLAGALGKPTWLMLPTPGEWRWLESREDTPWYPQMRLFRQNQPGNWDEVVERVKQALKRQVADMGSATAPRTVGSATSTPISTAAQWPISRSRCRPNLSAVTETRYGSLQYLPSEPLVGPSIGWYGEYLQPQLNLLARFLQPGATMMEVAAGVGTHALFAAATLGPKGHLFLYESRREQRRILTQNLAANGYSNVTVIEGQLRGELAREPQEMSPRDHAETIDELQLEHLTCMKINAEAAALTVLDGAVETLWRLRPILFISLSNESLLNETATGVREYGYRCWRMTTPLFNRDNFNCRDEDIFAGGTAVALFALPEEIETDVAIDGCVELS
jgi:Glycosyltransferase family 9 (heptosyltransferase)